MVKKVVVFTWSETSGQLYAKQLKSFFGDQIAVTVSSRADGLIQPGDYDAYVVSTCALQGQDIRRFFRDQSKVVITKVTLTKEGLERALDIPRGTQALMVNINPAMVTESIALLNQLGVNNIDLIGYSPDYVMQNLPDYALTPGEIDLVPTTIAHRIDLGPRLLTGETLMEVAIKLKLEHLLETDYFLDYIDSLADNRYSFSRLNERALQLDSLVGLFQDVFDTGIIGTDDQGRITTMNAKAEAILGVTRDSLMYQSATQVLPQLPFDEVMTRKKAIKTRLITNHSEMILISLSPIIQANKLVGLFAVLQKYAEEQAKHNRIRKQVKLNGHVTKYSFDDIKGHSDTIVRAKQLAHQLAQGDGSILITGESGTGKELFAHAIHDVSPRRDYPFVAISCAAIPDQLLESELFGYQEGAFTGAVKGGKAGYFEIADKGTLFLDEIECMSPMLQVKLLRVLQEKEVIRLGGQSVIDVDVRIIATTNENLLDLVRAGKFRKDLYYRINVFPVEIPPLRARHGDSLVLLEALKHKFGGQFELTKSATSAIEQHDWEGNVRELANCVEYLSQMKKAKIELTDLPQSIQPQLISRADSSPSWEDYLLGCGHQLERINQVVAMIERFQRLNRPVGRHSLAAALQSEQQAFSQQEIRTIFHKLQTMGLLEIQRGRKGSNLTPAGQLVAQMVKQQAKQA